MQLQEFQDTPFDDAEAFDDFRMSLQLNHDRIAAKMFSLSLFYKTYPLIERDASNKDWQQNLQQELGSIYKLLGMTGLQDFSGVDLDEEGEFSDFMQLLVMAEGRVNSVLGIY